MGKKARKHEVCWHDKVGDRLEKEGVLPGNIFEFHTSLSPHYMPGGIVETLGAEGALPKRVSDIKRVVVREIGGKEVELTANHYRVYKEFPNIRRQLG